MRTVCFRFNAIKLYQSMLFTLALGIGQKPSANVTDPESKTFCSLFQTQEIFKSHLTCEQQKVFSKLYAI